jgi:hypothetical protein
MEYKLQQKINLNNKKKNEAFSDDFGFIMFTIPSIKLNEEG